MILEKNKHNFNRSNERETRSIERPNFKLEPYQSNTISSKIRNSHNVPLEDLEQESMEMLPPVPHNYIKIQNEASHS